MAFQRTGAFFQLNVPAVSNTTVIGAAQPLPQDYDGLIITGRTRAVGARVDLYVQDSFDGGTTWFDFCHFTQVTGTAEATQVFTMSGGAVNNTPMLIIGRGTLTVPNLTIGVGVYRPSPPGPMIRLVATVGGAASGAAQVQEVSVFRTRGIN